MTELEDDTKYADLREELNDFYEVVRVRDSRGKSLGVRLISPAVIKENFLKVHVYYKHMATVKIREMAAVEKSELASEIGKGGCVN